VGRGTHLARENGQIRAENRGKSKVKIWNRTKNVVPLHCQNEGENGALVKEIKLPS
jgi:hypothetical protein